ncbi:hypothetical protein WS90_16730 [Burkholderia cepacia]|uniref:Uncharacterized protein n=2 Tax=Burkholderia cepacia TaxID=292 RepID=A0A103ZJF4_BURCE|nr:hypothetical protein WS90_16730 [Burkholderia cepacia]
MFLYQVLRQRDRCLAPLERVAMLLHQRVSGPTDFSACGFEAALVRPPDMLRHRLVQARVVFQHREDRPERVVVFQAQGARHATHPGQTRLVRHLAGHLPKQTNERID